MKRYGAWDIETAPMTTALALPYPEQFRQPPSNYSKPETIGAWREKDRAAWEEDRIKEFSFSPRTGRIVALSINYRGQEAIDLTAVDEKDEKDLILSGLTLLCDKGDRNDLIVGFNSRQFDWPFLMIRMCYHRIDPYAIQSHRAFWNDCNNRYSKYNVDLREMLTFGDYRAKGTLSDWSEWAGVGAKDTKGSQVWEWVQEGNADAIALHCRGDAHRTGAVFERVYPLYAGS